MKEIDKLKIKSSAFTIIELLVSISIIFILVSFIATSTSMAKISGQRAACLNNARVLNMMVEDGTSVIFGQERESRFIQKMRNYDGPVIIVNCYSCHPYIIDFDRKEIWDYEP